MRRYQPALGRGVLLAVFAAALAATLAAHLPNVRAELLSGLYDGYVDKDKVMFHLEMSGGDIGGRCVTWRGQVWRIVDGTVEPAEDGGLYVRFGLEYQKTVFHGWFSRDRGLVAGYFVSEEGARLPWFGKRP